MKKVEQINDRGEVILDYDEKHTSKKLSEIMNANFKLTKRKNSEFTFNIKDKIITFLVKNVTYLGHPHPLYTKRIQLSNGWEEKLKDENTFLLGIYNYENTRLYVYFDKTNFMNRELNNASAHVWTNDLLKGYKEGLFQKIDKNKNEIFVIREDFLHNFVIEKFVENKEIKTEEIQLFETFKNSLPICWNGIECYKEMNKADFIHKNQSEWAGWYFEFKFKIFLDENPNYKEVCTYIMDKITGATDLDIKFAKGYYGDLKTHSNNSGAILGNDKSTIFSSLSKERKIWYVVVSHDTIKDKDKDYEVTKFWNRMQVKSDLMSYGERMKNSVKLNNFQILEINDYNVNHLSDFNQGKQYRGGRARNTKIKINKSAINNFVIYESKLG